MTWAYLLAAVSNILVGVLLCIYIYDIYDPKDIHLKSEPEKYETHQSKGAFFVWAIFPAFAFALVYLIFFVVARPWAENNNGSRQEGVERTLFGCEPDHDPKKTLLDLDKESNNSKGSKK